MKAGDFQPGSQASDRFRDLALAWQTAAMGARRTQTECPQWGRKQTLAWWVNECRLTGAGQKPGIDRNGWKTDTPIYVRSAHPVKLAIIMSPVRLVVDLDDQNVSTKPIGP